LTETYLPVAALRCAGPELLLRVIVAVVHVWQLVVPLQNVLDVAVLEGGPGQAFVMMAPVRTNSGVDAVT
jgi:hypothetical protein